MKRCNVSMSRIEEPPILPFYSLVQVKQVDDDATITIYREKDNLDNLKDPLARKFVVILEYNSRFEMYYAHPQVHGNTKRIDENEFLENVKSLATTKIAFERTKIQGIWTQN